MMRWISKSPTVKSRIRAMVTLPKINLRAIFLASCLVVLAASSSGQAAASGPPILSANIGHGISLHYVEQGSGIPVVFVHGSLSDGGYWHDQIPVFAEHYHAIAYSRRYNSPNDNPAQPGYSAIADAEDLAAFIHTLHLGKVVAVGHSYGALTALFLAARHPELVRAVVLAEPPAVSLLQDLPGDEHARGIAMFDDLQQRMVKPMQKSYAKGDREAGVRIFIDYVFNDPQGWEKMSSSSREETMKAAHEWDVMMTTGTLFPTIRPQQVHKIMVPVLIMMGAKTYPFLIAIGHELGRLLPNSQTVIYPDAGHQMWFQNPEACRHDVEKFLANSGVQ
jgi:pimeloyl-ACP methyl ester carboxylesterase